LIIIDRRLIVGAMKKSIAAGSVRMNMREKKFPEPAAMNVGKADKNCKKHQNGVEHGVLLLQK
jgi:hypothetical protein